MPLSMLDTGASKPVIEIKGKDETRRFLESLGFTEGSTVTVVSKLAGNIIVSIKDSRIAIDKTMANHIMV